MKMNLALLLLIGLPGSGKTTLARTLISNFQNVSGKIYHYFHVCYDELIPFQNRSQELEWKSERTSVVELVKNLVIAIKTRNIRLCPTQFSRQFESISSWDSNIILILDDNMYFRSMRYSFFQIARTHSLSFCQVFLNCSLETALSNNSLRGVANIVPPHIIENMHVKMEPPNSMNNWEKYSVMLNAFCNSNEIQDKLFSVLNESLKNFVQEKFDNFEQKELSKIQCKKSVMHQTDIALRKIISLKMKQCIDNNPKEASKEYVLSLNLRKSEILSDIRTGNISLPDEVLEEINMDVTENYHLINFLGSYF